MKMLDALMVHCPSCRVSLPRERLSSHDNNQCLQLCPNSNHGSSHGRDGKGDGNNSSISGGNSNHGCDARLPRSLMSLHLSDECGYTSVTCSSSSLMCPWNGR
jgi:hypothetical protein